MGRHMITRALVNLQDDVAYAEPPPWYYTVRQSLGAALLEAGRGEEAAMVYQDDLRQWSENGWSLFGLMKSLRAQGLTREARLAEKRFLKAWTHADVALMASRF